MFKRTLQLGLDSGNHEFKLAVLERDQDVLRLNSLLACTGSILHCTVTKESVNPSFPDMLGSEMMVGSSALIERSSLLWNEI